MIGTGHLKDIQAGRELVRRSLDFRSFEPQDTADWDAAYARFKTCWIDATGLAESKPRS